MKLSYDQGRAAKRIESWAKQSSDDLTFGGLAGTGKTTILQHTWSALENAGAVAIAPTNKAADVLCQKGIPATTIHRLIYQFKGHDEDHRGRLQPIFVDRGAWGRSIEVIPKRLVCDEASMVTTRQWQDLKKRNIPILWCGDHGQLKPVGGDPGLMKNPDIRLEKIHRQAEGNPIIRMSMDVRKNGRITRFEQSDLITVTDCMNYSELADYVVTGGVNQVIVGTNRTRFKTNHLIRSRLGRTHILEKGDRIISLSNDHIYKIYNGQIYRVTSTPKLLYTDSWLTCLEQETLNGWKPRTDKFLLQDASFGNPDFGLEDALEGMIVADYGYAITCHKAQGSQWDNVLVIDESKSSTDYTRWLYTAITRASEKLTVLVNTLKGVKYI